MKALEPPDVHFARAAEGWLALGDHREAAEELDRISPANRAHEDVLRLRWLIFAKIQKWKGFDGSAAEGSVGGAVEEGLKPIEQSLSGT